MKTCTKCKKKLPLTSHKNNTKKDKLSNVCKSCSNMQQEWQEKIENIITNNQREQKIIETKGACVAIA